MVKTIYQRTCDVCGQKVDDFAGSLSLKYADRDYTGCGFPAGIERKEICLNCCHKLDKAITEALKELKEDD